MLNILIREPLQLSAEGVFAIMLKKVHYFLASKKSTARLFAAEKYPGFKSAKPTFF
ncbi:MAG: hypothetical protein BWY74_00730 [Firmicutes bacterium ADurb.Bin419]|nr:MAG: hypothetical protein BWY74_00730 [Firmicutes bacterium ADurb.Bin419]